MRDEMHKGSYMFFIEIGNLCHLNVPPSSFYEKCMWQVKGHDGRVKNGV